MASIDPWPLETITRDAFYVALKAINAPQEALLKLRPPTARPTVVERAPVVVKIMQLAGRARVSLPGTKAADKVPKTIPTASPDPEPEMALTAFRTAAATPEQRKKIAEATGFLYKDLTHWVVRADLMRVPGIDDDAAWVLALAGVVGVADLVAWTSDDRRRAELKQNFAKAINPKNPESAPQFADTREQLQKAFDDLKLEELGKAAREKPAQVITDTTVVLVVKGAGLQKPDDTLDVFLRGFWPACCQRDPQSTITKRHDVFPSDYRTSRLDREPLNHVTEIHSGERRAWIKEANWEVTVSPPAPIKTLFNEWRMATYTYLSMIFELLVHVDRRPPNEQELDQAGKLNRRPKWQREMRDGQWGQFFRAFWIANTSIFLFMAWVVYWTALNDYWLLPWKKLGAFVTQYWSLSPLQAWVQPAFLIAAVLIVPILLASSLANETVRKLTRPKDAGDGWRSAALPGLPSWMMVVLLLVFALSPAGYVLWLLVPVTVQLALLRARAHAWRYRELKNTDSEVTGYYSLEKDVDPATGQLRIYTYSLPGAKFRRLFIVIYRLVIVLGEPVTLFPIIVARVIQQIPPARAVGVWLETQVSQVLSGVLGDVVSYAMDPAQAHRVRSVIEAEIRFFHDCNEVSSLHVFAHSQGTPITFEVLFHHLPDAYRRKIRTYVTIGSVLSYVHQANRVLDPFYMARFPVNPYPDFSDEFKWINFWNLADPVTEFYGLDEYNLVVKAPVYLQSADGCYVPRIEAHDPDLMETKRAQASPTNIKTAATPANHSEYWENNGLVQGPFAKRVFGDSRPHEWDGEQPEKRTVESHARLVTQRTFLWLAYFMLVLIPLIAGWTYLHVFDLSYVSVERLMDILDLKLWTGWITLLYALGEFVTVLLLTLPVYAVAILILNQVYEFLFNRPQGARQVWAETHASGDQMAMDSQ